MAHVGKDQDSGGEDGIRAQIDKFYFAFSRDVVVELDVGVVRVFDDGVVDSGVVAHLRYLRLFRDDHHDKGAHGEHADRGGKAEEVDALATAKREEDT